MQQSDEAQLIKEPVAKDTKKLAQALYDRYEQNGKNPKMTIPVNKLCKLFGFDDSPASRAMLETIFLDLTEPIFVEDFAYVGKRYSNIMLYFCSFENIEKEGDSLIIIVLNEMFFEAMQRYFEINPYFQKTEF